MKKLNILIVFILAISLMSGCLDKKVVDKEVSPQKEKVEQKVDEQESTPRLFWKVENKGSTVYLLGSIHIANESFYPLDKKIETAFNNSTYLGVEADVKNIKQEEVVSFIQNYGIYKDGSTIKDHIDTATYLKLKKKLAEKQIDIEKIKLFEPWLFKFLLNETPDSYSPEMGIDMYFMNKVAKEQKVIELESTTFQLKLEDEMPEEVQIWLLNSALEGTEEEDEKAVDEIVKAWKSGDVKVMESLLKAGDDGTKEYDIYMENLIDKRNLGMTQKIESYLNNESKETYFIVVGAAHYVGENGIVQLLKNDGYTVEKVLE